jgi:hypothetical protein
VRWETEGGVEFVEAVEGAAFVEETEEEGRRRLTVYFGRGHDFGAVGDSRLCAWGEGVAMYGIVDDASSGVQYNAIWQPMFWVDGNAILGER